MHLGGANALESMGAAECLNTNMLLIFNGIFHPSIPLNPRAQFRAIFAPLLCKFAIVNRALQFYKKIVRSIF